MTHSQLKRMEAYAMPSGKLQPLSTLLKKNRFVLLLAFLFSPAFLFAQDIIIKNDKSEIKAKVVEITTDFIKYHDWDNLTGPIYNIARKDVFMINYQNGKREFITSTDNSKSINATNTTVSSNTDKAKSSPAEASSAIEVSFENSPYVYTPRDKKQPKSYTNFGDRMSYIGVAVNSIGKLTIPTIYTITDIFVAPNLAITYGVLLNYNSEEIMGYKMKSSAFGALVGGSYYLNKALKIDKNKAAIYVGAAANYTYVSVTSDFADGTASAGKFSGFARAGGKYNFTKRFGLFGEVQIGEGDPGIVAGLVFSFIK